MEPNYMFIGAVLAICFMGCQLIIVFLPIITSFNHFLYTISGNNTLISDENKCGLL